MGRASAVSYEADRSQQRAIKEPPADGIIEAMPLNYGTASVLSPEADESQKSDMSVVNREMSAADTKSELETDTGQKGADGSHEEEQGADGSHAEQRRAYGSH
jgi:uncharacterized membrane protein